MGGSFNIDIFKRNQYKPNTHNGDCLFRLSEFIKHVPLKEKTPNDIKLLPREIQGYSPLSPYINASQGVSSNGDARTYYVVDEKVIYKMLSNINIPEAFEAEEVEWICI